VFVALAPFAGVALSAWPPGDVWRACGIAAAFFALVAATRLVTELLVEPPPTWRRTTIALYRYPLLAGLTVLALGFLVERGFGDHGHPAGGWASVADEHKGTIVVLILVGVLLFAAVLTKFIVPPLVPRRRRRG
jgi:hypothetical protein